MTEGCCRRSRICAGIGRPHCARCYESLYAEPCQACGEPIGGPARGCPSPAAPHGHRAALAGGAR
uniref:Uncharacterized protein n=1 Tax=Nothoprocta perdicaria TaxID=30464 RepID=A0A8C6YW98_NOTPE